MPIAAGQNFGNFSVVRLVGEGGFGEVYEAENPFLQRRAAVKVLNTQMVQDPEMVRRFMNEARAASAIRHAGIVEVFDAGVTVDGEPYILMEYLEGDSLQKALQKRGAFPLELVGEILRQAGAALSAAHAAGIVHRDLKPENLFLLPNPAFPSGIQVKILDFGIAKIKHRDAASTFKTQVGVLMGSPTYMSPEQCRDSGDVDHRSDIYSLAIIAYEMLTGAPPFASPTSAEMLVHQLITPPPLLRSRVPSLPIEVEQVVLRALAKDRDHRYESVAAFVQAFLGNESDPVTPPPEPCGEKALARPSPAIVTASSENETLPTEDASAGVPTTTTLSHTTGESAIFPGSHQAPGTLRLHRWASLGVAVTTLLAIAGMSWFYVRSRPHPTAKPVAQPQVRVQVASHPAGADVIEKNSGKMLGKTPLAFTQTSSPEPLYVLLKLAGHMDRSVTISLLENFSAEIELQPLPPMPVTENGRVPTLKKSAENSRKKNQRPKKTKESEDEWRLH